MSTPFALRVLAEHTGTEAKSKLWTALRIDAAGPALEKERAPLALALVIDTSGSMQGDALNHALKACELVGDLLTDRDRLSIVTFSSTAGVRCGMTVMDDAGKALVRQSLLAIQAGGNTNMHGGIEVAAGVLVTAPAGLRRAMVVLSDGQPNVGFSAPDQLANYVKSLNLAVSTLGFGLHHDENVLQAIATAGSGRYAYIADPIVARVDMARAALAHGGVVADQIEVRIKLLEGVELLQLVPQTQLRHSGSGVVAPIGDVFVDEGRVVAIELALDLPPATRGRIAEITVTGRSVDGKQHDLKHDLVLDIRSGAPKIDRAAQREIVGVLADVARAEARLQADRRAYPAAAAILKKMIARIDGIDGFVANDGSELAELREQLVDEVTAYESNATDSERVEQRKQMMAYNYRTPSASAPAVRAQPPILARLVGIAGAAAGQIQLLAYENTIGRTMGNDIVLATGQCSKRHARIVFTDGKFVAIDLKSSNGTVIGGRRISTQELVDGDEIAIGDSVFRFEMPPRS